MTAVDRPSITGRIPLWSLVLTVLAVIAVVLAAFVAFGGALLPDRSGPPIEELSIERTTLAPGSIEITVRNTGPDPVQIAQVFVNDTYVDFTGSTKPIARLGSDTLQLRFPWISGQPYTVSMLTSTGLVIEHTIPAAVARPGAGCRSGRVDGVTRNLRRHHPGRAGNARPACPPACQPRRGQDVAGPQSACSGSSPSTPRSKDSPSPSAPASRSAGRCSYCSEPLSRS